MYVNPSEFLKMSHKRGVSNVMFKHAMIHITANIIPIHVALAQGKKMYFRMPDDSDNIDFMLRKESEVNESQVPHTEAFKLLKLIAD